MEPQDALIQSAVFRERYTKGSITRILNVLRDAEIDLAARISARLDRLSDADKIRYGRNGDLTTVRLRALRDAIVEFSAEWRRIAAEHVDADAKEIAAIQLQLAEKALAIEGIVGAGVSTTQVVAAAYARPLQGRHLKPLFKDAEANVRRTVEKAIRNGIITGQTTPEIVRTIIGTKALKYNDGDLAKHRRGISSVVRTATNHIANVTNRETFLALGAEHFRLLVTLDGRTSQFCRGISGLVQRVDDPKSIWPTFHLNCRTITVFDDGEPLTGERAANGSDGPGPVDANLTFEPWLRRQSKAFQLDTLGRSQYLLWSQGKLPLRSFVDVKGLKPLSVEQLRQRHSGLFEQLGI